MVRADCEIMSCHSMYYLHLKPILRLIFTNRNPKPTIPINTAHHKCEYLLNMATTSKWRS